MTKRDYVLLASILRNYCTNEHVELFTDDQLALFRGMTKGIAKELKVDNPKFDETRFLTACGIEPPKGV